jgi:hypothetical protein
MAIEAAMLGRSLAELAACQAERGGMDEVPPGAVTVFSGIVVLSARAWLLTNTQMPANTSRRVASRRYDAMGILRIQVLQRPRLLAVLPTPLPNLPLLMSARRGSCSPARAQCVRPRTMACKVRRF